MKQTFKMMAAFFVTTVALAATAHAKEIQIGINDVFIPAITANTDASVIVSGIFPNGCYHWARGTVTNVAEDKHELRFYAEVTPGMCIMVLVPFTKEVQIGRLSRGVHKFRFLSGDDTFIEREVTVN